MSQTNQTHHGNAATAEAEPIRSLHVTTDGSVDCSSVKSIVAGVCKARMSDQEKAVALYNFARQLMFHYPNRVDGQAIHDTLHLLNTYGYSFCSQQALVTVHLWQTAGLGAEVWGVPHHATMQAYYDDDYHWFDLLIGGYVYRRDGKTIASMQDIKEDPSILMDAAKEGRVPTSFMACGKVLQDDACRFTVSESNIKFCTQFADDVEQMTDAARVAAKWKHGDPSPSRYKSGFNLRAGETITYLWDFIPDQANVIVMPTGPERPAVDGPTAKDLPPHHFCGKEAEQRDVDNAALWQRYRKPVAGVETGRYAANGRHIYEPDLSGPLNDGDWLENSFVSQPDADEAEGRPCLRVADAGGEPSTLIFPLTMPHVYTGGTLTVQFMRAAEDDISQVYISTEINERNNDDAGRQRQLVWDGASQNAGAGLVTAVVPLEEVIRDHREVRLEIQCATTADPRQAGVQSLHLDAIFQHNMFARPYLVKGSNQVTIHADNVSSSPQVPLQITYQWQAEDVPKSHTQLVTQLPCTYAIEVGGEDDPRMVQLEMSAG